MVDAATQYPPEIVEGVFAMLNAGSARLAYARAKGVSLVPYDILVPALFSSAGVTAVPDAGNQEKIQQDTIIRKVDYQITNQNSPAGFDSITNEFFALNSGIQARMKIIAAGGGYNPVPDFQPLELIKREFPRGWLLTYNNGIKMDFQASVPLPFAVQVNVVFHGETVYWLPALQMTNADAFRALQALGYNVNGYMNSGL